MVAKYRYKVLKGSSIAVERENYSDRDGEARDIVILQGSVGKGHIHILLSLSIDKHLVKSYNI